jgi:hypothetical protein
MIALSIAFSAIMIFIAKMLLGWDAEDKTFAKQSTKEAPAMLDKKQKRVY